MSEENANRKLLGTDLSKRRYGLDILRAFAIMFVFVGHSVDMMPSSTAASIVSFFIMDGVGIFFVLSGFLIGSILIKTINKSFTKRDLFVFWFNRWMRTLPPYYFILFLLFALYGIFDIYLYPEPLSTYEKLKYVFFVQNFAWIQANFFSESWSLCVEEWFYLLIPTALFILCTLLKVKPKKSILITVIGIIITVTCYRWFRHDYLDLDYTSNYHYIFFHKQVLTRLDSIMYGVLAAFIYYYYEGFWYSRKNRLFAAGLLLAFVLAIFGIYTGYYNLYSPGYWFYRNVFGFALFSVSIMLMLPYLNTMPQYSGRIFKIITYISLISYSLYLVHYTLVKHVILKEFIHLGQTAEYILYWVLGFGFATVMYRFLERPVMDARPKILKKLKK